MFFNMKRKIRILERWFVYSKSSVFSYVAVFGTTVHVSADLALLTPAFSCSLFLCCCFFSCFMAKEMK